MTTAVNDIIISFQQFTKTGVEFKDGSSVDDIDVVILATGYSFGFPFLDKEVSYSFPPNLTI